MQGRPLTLLRFPGSAHTPASPGPGSADTLVSVKPVIAGTQPLDGHMLISHHSLPLARQQVQTTLLWAADNSVCDDTKGQEGSQATCPRGQLGVMGDPQQEPCDQASPWLMPRSLGPWRL